VHFPDWFPFVIGAAISSGAFAAGFEHGRTGRREYEAQSHDDEVHEPVVPSVIFPA
jgi:hypothetical protein